MSEITPQIIGETWENKHDKSLIRVMEVQYDSAGDTVILGYRKEGNNRLRSATAGTFLRFFTRSERVIAPEKFDKLSDLIWAARTEIFALPRAADDELGVANQQFVLANLAWENLRLGLRLACNIAPRPTSLVE